MVNEQYVWFIWSLAFLVPGLFLYYFFLYTGKLFTWKKFPEKN